MIEAATAAMLRAFLNEWRDLDDWFDEAIRRRSLALLNRILIALRQIRRSADPEKAAWAREVLEARIDPAIEELLAQGSRESA